MSLLGYRRSTPQSPPLAIGAALGLGRWPAPLGTHQTGNAVTSAKRLRTEEWKAFWAQWECRAITVPYTAVDMGSGRERGSTQTCLPRPMHSAPTVRPCGPSRRVADPYITDARCHRVSVGCICPPGCQPITQPKEEESLAALSNTYKRLSPRVDASVFSPTTTPTSQRTSPSTS